MMVNVIIFALSSLLQHYDSVLEKNNNEIDLYSNQFVSVPFHTECKWLFSWHLNHFGYALQHHGKETPMFSWGCVVLRLGSSWFTNSFSPVVYFLNETHGCSDRCSHNPATPRCLRRSTPLRTSHKSGLGSSTYIQNLHSFWAWRSVGPLDSWWSAWHCNFAQMYTCTDSGPSTNTHTFTSPSPTTHPQYDNRQSIGRAHAIPVELHVQGVLKIHQGECRPSSR